MLSLQRDLVAQPRQGIGTFQIGSLAVDDAHVVSVLVQLNSRRMESQARSVRRRGVDTLHLTQGDIAMMIGDKGDKSPLHVWAHALRCPYVTLERPVNVGVTVMLN